jgi:hypothetical protein
MPVLQYDENALYSAIPDAAYVPRMSARQSRRLLALFVRKILTRQRSKFSQIVAASDQFPIACGMATIQQ